MGATEQELNRERELLALEEQRLRNRERLNALESDAVGLSSSLVDSIKEIQGISTKRSTFDQNLLKINKQIGNEIIGQKRGLTDISSIQKQIDKNQNLIEKSQKTANSLTNSLSVAEKRRVDFANNYAKEINEQKKIQNKLLEDSEKGLGFDKEAYDLSVEKQFQQERNLENVTKNLSNTAKQAVFSKQNLDILKEQNEERKKELEFEEKVNKNLGITGNLLKGAEGFLNKIGLGALSNAIGFDEINKKVEKFARELEDIEPNLSEAEKKQRVMNKSFELMGKSLTEALNDPLVSASILLKVVSSLAGKIAEGFQRSQVNTGALAKNLNITNGEAMELSKSFSQASFGSDRLFVSSKGLTETLVAINSELGTSVQLTSEELLTFTKLRETAGLTNEELMGIQSLSLANGESFDANADSILNQVSALNRASGIYLNEKEVLKDISKLSAATTLSLGKNPKALAEAVSTAKSLGIEMSKLDNIASSLLQFEDSISSELEAELLLGRDINLEKARQAALNNDLATLAKEIADQAGSAAEFGEMNRIQQEAIAKAVGMNREDLAQTLFVQEQLAGVSGEEAERRQKLLDTRIEEVGLAQAQRELEENGLENMLNQATASEKMQASQEKINELFTAFGAMFAPIVDMFANVAGFIMESKLAMGVLAAIAGGLVGVLSAMAAKSIVSAISAIFTGAASLGPFGIPLAMGGVAALIGAIAAGASAATAVGDVMSPSSGKTMVSTKEGGLYELSKNDDLVAAPGAIERMKNSGSTTVVQQASPPDNTESKRTNALLEKIANQSPVFKIGTDEFFTSTSKYSYQVQ
jgi:hypothetical protein